MFFYSGPLFLSGGSYSGSVLISGGFKSQILLYHMFVSVYCLDSSPTCEDAYRYLEVPENAVVGSMITEIKCVTTDQRNAHTSYAIKSGNTHGKFGINTTNGAGVVYVHQAISFESRTVSFQVRTLYIVAF